MNAQVPGRGTDLVAGGRRLRLGPRWLARLWAGGLNRVLDRIDARLVTGSIVATLPDGTMRVLGNRAPGFAVEVRLTSARALVRLVTGGSVGWYQAWEAGEWDSPDPVALFALFTANAVTLDDTARAHGPWRWAMRVVHRLHRNTRAGSLRNIHAHYDLGNDFYAAWLGPTMLYSSAMFADPPEPSGREQRLPALDHGQRKKLEAVADRIDPQPGERILEIGCGWGALATVLAGTGAHVDAISLSEAQLAYCRDKAVAGPGAERLSFRKLDYRDVREVYDGIVSVEMVEALGREHWPDFLDSVTRSLKPGGRAVLQFISIAEPLFDSYARSADFIQTYVFPGGMLIRSSEFRALAETRGLRWTDEVAFGEDYAETLRLWRDNFDCAVDEGRLPAGFDHRFVRLWRYYLMYCEGGFRGGAIDVAQVTLIRD